MGARLNRPLLAPSFLTDLLGVSAELGERRVNADRMAKDGALQAVLALVASLADGGGRELRQSSSAGFVQGRLNLGMFGPSGAFGCEPPSGRTRMQRHAHGVLCLVPIHAMR